MDALDKMNDDIRAIAKQVEYGEIFFPRKEDPGLTVKVHDGRVSMVIAHLKKGGVPCDIKYKS